MLRKRGKGLRAGCAGTV
jgi:NADPH:quinone reductase-like Zn-dependent oxidoreductase